MADNFIEQLVENVGKIPTAKVNRTEYLRSCFGINYSDKMEDILKYGPVEGGVPVKEVKAIARKAIYNESAITIGTSFLTGLPGGAAMIATIPTDITQYYLHLIRIAQKLLFLYGWEKNVYNQIGDMDPEGKTMLYLSLGVMSGVGFAASAMAKVIGKGLGKAAQKALVCGVIKKCFTKSVARTIVKNIGVKQTARGLFKIVPGIGGVFSAGVTAITFVPSTYKLETMFRKHTVK